MSSSKRSLSDFNNKEEFPFNIYNGIIRYPKLYSKINKSDNIRFWYIYAILMNGNNEIDITNNLIDIKQFKYFLNFNNYKNLKIYIYTEYGLIEGKLTETTPTIIDTGKNLNKKNETSIITQSLILMRNLYLKKIKTGYSTNLEDINIQSSNTNIFPMAVHEYSKHKSKIKYPCFAQYKLDGIRLIAKYDIETDTVTLLSRRLNTIFGFENVKDDLKYIFKLNPNIIIDGELYNHNLSLQEISGIVRHQDTELAEKKDLFFYVFDYIDLYNKVTFEERINNLEKIFKKVKKLDSIKLLDTYVINNEQDGNKLFNKALKEKYEGIIYKNTDALYQYSTIKETRTYEMLKRKNSHSAEYKIVGFEGGKGKDLNAITFILETPEGYTFHAVPNMPLATRKEMFKLAEKDFDNEYRNKYGTVNFDDYSKDKNIPMRAKFITIRDYE